MEKKRESDGHTERDKLRQKSRGRKRSYKLRRQSGHWRERETG